MESPKSKQIKIGAFLSYSQMFISTLISLIYTPIMLRLLGQSEYGLYNTVSSTISMLSLLNLGFSSGYIRYYAQYKKQRDNESIYKLNGLFLTIFVLLGLIAFLCGIYLTGHLELVFKDGLTIEEYNTANVLMLLLTVNLSLSFPMSVFGSIISAHERFIFIKTIGILNTIVSPLVTLPVLLMGYKSIGLVVVTVAISITTYIINAFFVFVKLKQKFKFGRFDKTVVWGLFHYTVFIGINIIVNQVNLNVDKLILTRYKGTTAVAIYSVGYMLQHYYQMFSVSISDLFTPRIHFIYSDLKLSETEKKGHIDELFSRVGRIQFAILGLIMSGVIFFGKEFIFYWAGDGYDEAYYVALLLMIPLTVPLIQNIGIEIQRAQNKHKFRSIAYAIMAVVNLTISIPLCIAYGPVGSAIGTCISFVLANGIIMNMYYYKKMNIDIPSFWRSILSLGRGMIIPALAGAAIISLIHISNPLVLVLLILLYTTIYFVSLWLIGLNNYEKGLIRGVRRKVLKR